MNKLIRTFFLFCFFTVSPLIANDQLISDYIFHQEKMVVDHGEIILVSTFDKKDAITVYNFNGQRLWEVKFHAKIIAWDVQPSIIFIFSKDRKGSSTYLTCLDRVNGRCIWEKP